MNWQISRLPWLLPAPADFRALCQALEAEPGRAGPAVQRLANFCLDAAQLTRLAKTIAALDQGGADLRPLTPLRLGLLSNGTTDLIAPPLVASAARFGIKLEIIQSAFDQAVQEALSPRSVLNSAKPDVVLLALDHRGLPLAPSPGDVTGAEAALTASLAHIATLRRGIRAACGAPLIVQTVAPPPLPLFGGLDAQVAGTPRHVIAEFNRRLAAGAQEAGDMVLDVAALAETVGLDAWHDATYWNLGKLAFAQDFVPIYADWVGRLLGALRGKSRKCLVLDLDNTVWGGVIGDDGLEGIVLANGDPTGEAFLEVQRTALALRGRGIMLAVSSKNDDAVARSAFRHHPDMLLREEHISVFQANWRDKAANLRAIAETLNIGIDALVFLDDNPAERAQVRQSCPEVAVPELPPDPALYARTLVAAGYFEAISFSDEDRQRAASYEANARRADLEANATDLDSYLRSLQMEAILAPFDRVGRARISQLINKSNQFNLTTRRYTPAQVQAVEEDPRCLTLQVRLTDCFGDNGMICAVICVPAEDGWEIDTWLMSCRVLNRKVEQVVLNHLVAAARGRNIPALIGRYIPTEKNGLVRDHYEKLGFRKIAETNGATVWRLDVASYEPAALPVTVRIADPVGA